VVATPLEKERARKDKGCMREISKSDLHKIGHLRGIDQYEVLSDMSLLVLCCGDRYFLSKVDNWETDYNKMILARISLFYRTPSNQNAWECLGEPIKVIEGDK